MTLADALSLTRGQAADLAAAPPARRLLPRLWRHPGARVGIVLAVLLVAVAVIGPFVLPYDPNVPNYGDALQAPSGAHYFGTDASGRDTFSRIVDGAHRSLGAALLVLAIVSAIGLAVGTLAGMIGGWVDTLLMRIVDVVMTIPSLVLAIAIVGLLGPGFVNLLIAMIAADWAYYARLSRSYVLTARQRPDVIAARMAGISWPRTVWRHVIPQVATQMAVVASLGLSGMIVVIAGFSFLGLGVQPPDAEWGSMIESTRFYFTIAPWLLVAPGAAIFLSVLASNLIGNGIRDILDPSVQR